MYRSRWLVILCISAIAVVLHSYIYVAPWGQRIELFVLDRWFSLRGPMEAPDDVVLVAMDEDSYQELGVPLNGAWPRDIHAELLVRLSEAGAKRAVFDILFLGAGQDPVADRDLAEGLLSMPSVIGVDVGRSVGDYEIEQLLFPYRPFRDLAEKNALI
ncbi:MAG: CHASE2 domain-containing protein, partial [Bdellovibrionales bacterium]|nr:CHASE2 domain-containing protein [Bdellovibrionales bacterium]